MEEREIHKNAHSFINSSRAFGFGELVSHLLCATDRDFLVRQTEKAKS